MTRSMTKNARRIPPQPSQPQDAAIRQFGADTSPHIDAVHAGLVLLPLRIFLAAGWLRAGAEKVIDLDWWRGDTLRGFLDTQRGVELPYFQPIAEHVIRPLAAEVAVIVVVAQILIGLSLAFGRPLRVALWAGVVLNVVFIMAGRVNPSAFYLFMEVALLYGVSVGTIGHTRTRRSVRPIVTVTVFLMFALTQIPFIRTIEPAKVIEDPAMMLTFLCFATVVTTLLRVTRNQTSTYATRRNLGPLWSLLLCRPEWSLKYAAIETWVARHDATALTAMTTEGQHDEPASWGPPELSLNAPQR